jgi:hypothetical protein
MDTISYSAFRTRLASTLDKVNDDQFPQFRLCALEPPATAKTSPFKYSVRS